MLRDETVQVEVKEAPVAAKEPEVEAAPEPAVSAKESLTVTTELGNRDAPLYEPVSPTPLPDSPCDEAKPSQPEQKGKPGPFEEVIVKKAAVAGIDRVEAEVDAAKAQPKISKKKVSAAEKKKQLNSKGEKGRDLLDVFTAEPKEPEQQQTVEVVRKIPTPEAAAAEEAKEEVAALAESFAKVKLAPKEEPAEAERDPFPAGQYPDGASAQRLRQDRAVRGGGGRDHRRGR